MKKNEWDSEGDDVIKCVEKKAGHQPYKYMSSNEENLLNSNLKVKSKNHFSQYERS
jgi:hypothetical protein